MKNIKRTATSLILMFILLGLIAGVYFYNKNKQKITIEGSTFDLFIPLKNLVNINPGTKVGNFTVKSVSRLSPERLDIPLDQNARVVFSGQVSLTGEYEYFGDNEGFLFDEVCFTADQNSKNKLPRFFDTSRPFFCFSNKAKAAEAFGPKGSKGTATVTIDNFNLVYLESEVWNTAELISAVKGGN